MKKLLYSCLSVTLCLLLAAGCASRGETSAAASQPQVSSSAPAESTPAQPEAPEASSAPKEEVYPLPALNDTEQKMLLEELKSFVRFFGEETGPATPGELDPEDSLLFCLTLADRQKDFYGYYFEQEGDSLLISAAIVGDTAQRMLGLERFAPTDSALYDKDTDCYRYTPGESATTKYALSSPKGAPDEGISYDVEFFDDGQDAPAYTLRFTFQIGRLNGMPYLQLLSKKAL